MKLSRQYANSFRKVNKKKVSQPERLVKLAFFWLTGRNSYTLSLISGGVQSKFGSYAIADKSCMTGKPSEGGAHYVLRLGRDRTHDLKNVALQALPSG